MTLKWAHQGYEYQDLLSALRFVDVMLGSVRDIQIDVKLVRNDIFDDLTTVDHSGVRDRVQIKYASNIGQVLPLSTFTSDSRNLRLDRICSSILNDRNRFSSDENHLSYRIIMTDQCPTDPRLRSVLKPADPDPGPFVPGLDTIRMKFDIDALSGGGASFLNVQKGTKEQFEILKNSDESLSLTDFTWVCDHLIIELGAPSASFDMTQPDKAESLLLRRVRDEVGAEVFPNDHRSAIDVSSALVGIARYARHHSTTLTVSELFHRTQLRSNYGAVSRANPVNQSLEVQRSEFVKELVHKAGIAAESGDTVLLVGSPGQGKSWLCQQFVDALNSDEWLVAEHYCYLGDADSEKLPRVQAETIFGSLLTRLADFDSDLLSEQRPKLAANEQALTDAVKAARAKSNNRPVALIVDGLDHISRVIRGSSSYDPSLLLARALATLRLPPGSVLIVLSQPGEHMNPFECSENITINVPSLTDAELRELAERLGVIGGETITDSIQSGTSPVIEEGAEAQEFIKALSERSSGNALYATYLCRETVESIDTTVRPARIVRDLPEFDGTLDAYYEHILTSLGSESACVADVFALMDFSVSVEELKEILPDARHRVDAAIKVLRPVLSFQATHAGVRVYHESFARYLCTAFQDDEIARIELLKRITKWLKTKGLLEDSRAFRHLLPMLLDAKCNQEVLDYVDVDFVTNSVAAGFAASEINKNLTTAVRSATDINKWGIIGRYVEMSRSLAHFETEERFESTVERFADVVVPLISSSVLSDRLLHNGYPTMSTRAGLRMCSVIDEKGIVAPWHEYMLAYSKESCERTTELSDFPNSTLDAALLRGRLRLAQLGGSNTSGNTQNHKSAGQREASAKNLYAPIRWDSLVERLNKGDLSPMFVVQAILDTFGISKAVETISKLAHPSAFYLALAESAISRNDNSPEYDPREWVGKAIEHGLPSGYLWRIPTLGLDVEDVVQQPLEEARESLLKLTSEVQDFVSFQEIQTVLKWMDACVVAAKRDKLGLASAEALLDGPGWYRCWLRFVIALALNENAPSENQSSETLAAICLLGEVKDPFIGEPRACDLLPIHPIIDETILRAVSSLNDNDWGEAIEILDNVSGCISTSMNGEVGGPLSRHSLLSIVVKTAPPTRWNTAQQFLNEEIEAGGCGNFYADLAHHRLLTARHGLANDKLDEARMHWTNACQLLLGYGSHKDSTIYEVVDPLMNLVKHDPKRSRELIAKLQPLCERVPFHTDGRGTRRAWACWLKLLARGDPCGLSKLIEPSLGSCNDPNDLLQGARSDLWRAWYKQADPVVAGALRLTLDEALDPEDVFALRQLSVLYDKEEWNGASKLFDALLSRIDERPVKYGYSADEDPLDRDQKLVDEINEIATSVSASKIAQLPESGDQEDGKPDSYQHPRTKRSRLQMHDQPTDCFTEGAAGIRQAMLACQEFRYDEPDSNGWIPRFTNILGYRLIELLDEQRDKEVEIVLDDIGNMWGFGHNSTLLFALAEGFERHKHYKLASVAFTLAWTRAQGVGDWKMFGAKKNIESLRRAVKLGHETAIRTVAKEVERIVSSRSESMWLTQSLIYGFTDGCLASDTTFAFDIWEEAFRVIENRAPRISDEDDPEIFYEPPLPDHGSDPPGDIDTAFATAILSGLFHPGREQKRRTLFAIQILIEERPTKIAPAINSALLTISDVTTLTWLLRTITDAKNQMASVVTACREALIELAGRPHLVVRSLARQLLPDVEVPLPSASEPDLDLIPRGPVDRMDSTYRDKIASELEPVVDEIAGNRLNQAEEILPGLRLAVTRRFTKAWKSDEFKRRAKRQRDAYQNQFAKRIPDIFIHMEETIENAIQHAASGARAARLINEDLSSDPVQLENSLAEVLINEPQPALAIEATRQPRPEIPPPPHRGHQSWNNLRNRVVDDTVDGKTLQDQEDGEISGTLSISEPHEVPTVISGAYEGWRLVATHERREVLHQDWNSKINQIVERFRAIELRNQGDDHGLMSPPVPLIEPVDLSISHDLHNFLCRDGAAQPVVGGIAPRTHGLGIPIMVLNPTQWLVAVLQIKNEGQFTLDDSKGRVMALITWRTEYETSDYFLAWPRLCGSGLVIRPDAFDVLINENDEQLLFRDFLKSSSFSIG